MCRERRAWQGETKQRTLVRNEEQHRQDHPGVCPKCGMALEPEMPSLDEGENPELRDFKQRFAWTLPLTVAVTVLVMAGHRLQWFDMATQSWIEPRNSS